MSDDKPFDHGDRPFARRRFPSGVDIDDGQARYAELVAEVIWDGVISQEGRQRLTVARDVYRVAPERAAQIEKSVVSAQAVFHGVPVREYDDLEEETFAFQESDPSVDPGQTMAPLAPNEDPRLSALQRRIDVVEQRNATLLEERTKYRTYVRELEQLVGQLQEALEATLQDLDEAGGDLTGHTSSEPAGSDAPEAGLDVAAMTPGMVAGAEGDFDIDGDSLPPPGLLETGVRQSARSLRPEEIAEAIAASAADDRDAEAAEGAAPPPLASRTRSTMLSLPEIEGLEVLDVATVSGGRLVASPDRMYEELQQAPRDAGRLRRLFDVIDPSDVDRRWGIAQALVFLEAAAPEHRSLAERGLRPSLIRPERAVSDEEWAALVAHRDDDPLVGEILGAIAPAVLLGHLSNMRASIAPEVVDPGARVDPKTSTVQAVRCFSWAADVLGIMTPAMYATPDEDRGADVVLNPVPVSRLGARVLRGRDNRELTFLAGSHLNWFRREHLLGQPERSVRRLEDMFLGALMIGNPGIPMTAEVKERVAPTAAWIRPLLDEPTVARLREAFGRFVEQGGRTNLSRWYRGVQRTGWRAGLFLCEDLSSAARALANDLPHDSQIAIDELIAYACSPTLAKLRNTLGVALVG
ncbi:MAG: hypothetical protein AAGA56_04790 [Myxococcota bacterium]